MFEEIKNLNDLNKGIHKQWIYSSKENYFIMCDYLQKINYSIQDINCELKNEQFKMKEIVYIIVLVDWIKSSFKKIKSLVIQDVIKKYKFSNEDRLKQAKDYFEAIRSYAVAHPLETTRHSNYGFDGDFICVDIRGKDIVHPFYSEKYCLIYDQDLYHTWKMGNQYLDVNGCGAIATYNVMYLLGKRQKLYDTVYYYDATGGTLLFGYLGTDPTSISSYFKAQKITCKSYNSISSLQNAANDISYDKYIIMCFWNDKNDIRRGAHYIAIRKTGSSYYQAYNSSTKYGTTLEYFYKNNYKDGSYIGGWIVG